LNLDDNAYILKQRQPEHESLQFDVSMTGTQMHADIPLRSDLSSIASPNKNDDTNANIAQSMNFNIDNLDKSATQEQESVVDNPAISQIGKSMNESQL